MTDKLPFAEIEKLFSQHIVMSELRDFYRRRIGDEIEERLQMAIAKHLKAYEVQNIKSKSELEKKEK